MENGLRAFLIGEKRSKKWIEEVFDLVFDSLTVFCCAVLLIAFASGFVHGTKKVYVCFNTQRCIRSYKCLRSVVCLCD